MKQCDYNNKKNSVNIHRMLIIKCPVYITNTNIYFLLPQILNKHVIVIVRKHLPVNLCLHMSAYSISSMVDKDKTA